MNKKELRRLRRSELLELLLLQTKEMEYLQEKLEKVEAELAERRVKMERIGNLAEAVLEINGVVAAAQAAADQYIENIMAMEEETRIRCTKSLQEAGLDSSMINSIRKQENIDETTD